MTKPRHPNAERYIAARAEGKTYKEIAQMYGVSYQAVQQSCARHTPHLFKPYNDKQVVYAGLRNWMNSNKISRAELIRRMGLIPHGTEMARCGDYLRGDVDLKKKTIDKLLEVTGLTYEDAFRR